MPMIFEMFPEEYIELQKELQYHPDLVNQLQRHNGDPHLDVRVFHCAQYCNILLGDAETGGFGEYTPESIARLAGIVAKKLREMRDSNPVKGLTIIHDMPPDLQ